MNELTADETSNLFMTYMTNSMASNVTADLLKKEDEPWVKQMLDFVLKLANY
ncbi:hypothetical protein [Salipaludibacillus neizhouensis]|uniref:hypothetical protein n=1 Tax=Salipaludibacillus neizhouensis TaxID=885475 RepID=UPI0015FEE8AC|nr:hypothetical protein [Salipaludibacillus neizhouensis]